MHLSHLLFHCSLVSSLTIVRYYTNHEFYSYDDQNGPFNIQGEDKNMYQRCFRACDLINDQEEYGRDKFLLNIVKKNDFAKIKSCNWLKKKPRGQEKEDTHQEKSDSMRIRISTDSMSRNLRSIPRGS